MLLFVRHYVPDIYFIILQQKEIEKEIAGKSAEDKIRDVDLIVQVQWFHLY